MNSVCAILVFILPCPADRYKLLPSLEPRLLFCRLQVQSVEVFSQSIVKRMEAELGDCTGMMFASLLCAVQYVADVLSEWSEQPVSY